MNGKIYKALKDEPNVDMVIIKEQHDNTEFEKIMREFAWMQLNEEISKIESKFVWDDMK